MIKKVLSITALFFFATSLAVMAQVKIGYMDTQKVMSKLPERQKVQKKLQDYIQQKRAQLTARSTEYQDSLKDYENKKASMSTAQIKKTENHLASMHRKLNDFSQQLKQQIGQKRSDLLSPVLDRIDKAISAVAKSDGLDFVLNKSVNTGDQVIFYADKSQHDITQQVIKQLASTNGN